MSDVEKSEERSCKKDKRYVNTKRDHEMKYDKKRKRKFGESNEDA